MNKKLPTLLGFASLTAAGPLVTQVAEGPSFNEMVVFTNRGKGPVDFGTCSLWTAYKGETWGKSLETLATRRLLAGDPAWFATREIHSRQAPTATA